MRSFVPPHHHRFDSSRRLKSDVDFLFSSHPTYAQRFAGFMCGAFDCAGRSSYKPLVSTSCLLLSRNEAVGFCDQGHRRLQESSGEGCRRFGRFRRKTRNSLTPPCHVCIVSEIFLQELRRFGSSERNDRRLVLCRQSQNGLIAQKGFGMGAQRPSPDHRRNTANTNKDTNVRSIRTSKDTCGNTVRVGVRVLPRWAE